MSKPILWNPLVNIATFAGAGYYLGGDVLAKFSPLVITPKEFAIAGAFNALVVSSGEYLMGTDVAQGSLKNAAVAIISLAAAAMIAPRFFKATSKWTGIVLTSESMKAIALFDGAIKVVSFALLYFTQYLKDSVSPEIPTTLDETRNASLFSLSILYDIFKKDTIAWNNLSLSMRVVLNRSFFDEGNEVLPFHGFKENAGEGLTLKEIKFLHEQTKKVNAFSTQERKKMNALFYRTNLSPQKFDKSPDALPSDIEKTLENLEAAKIASLPRVQLEWICLYYIFNPKKLKALPLADRFQWKDAFFKELGKSLFVNPSLGDIANLLPEQFKILSKQYQDPGGLQVWSGLDVPVQKALNLKWETKGLQTLIVNAQPEKSVKPEVSDALQIKPEQIEPPRSNWSEWLAAIWNSFF